MRELVDKLNKAMVADKKLYPIVYDGKTYNTTIHKDLTDEEFASIKNGYYTKPNFEDVKKQFLKIENNGVKTNYITNYYFKELMAKVKIHYNNWTIEQAINYKPIMEFFAGKADNNKKVFPDTMPLYKKIETAFRLCGFKVASKPSVFPYKVANEIIQKYNINNNYYDFSCGWGTRLLASLKNRVNYYGTDPNYLLVDKLNELYTDYANIVDINNVNVDIRDIGSEKFIPEWENKMGLAFSSPPYYNLEDYKIGNQSWKDGVKYDEWKECYLTQTIKNIYRYLIDDGWFLININNFNKYNNYDLIKDTIDISKTVGFELYDFHTLKNIKRCHGHKEWGEHEVGWYNNDEKIFVFKKL